MSGLLIAAPSSGSGKTTITLGLLRAMRRRGEALAAGKAGPDYIDPAFHAFASGVDCVNFDPWAMRADFLKTQAATLSSSGETLVVEAMMGLFDAAADGRGSPADLASLLSLKIVLVVDCARMSHSVAALVHGYSTFRSDISIAGLILNKVGSERHEQMLRKALEPLNIPVLGVVRSNSALALPERYLGLVQAEEHNGLEAFVELAADTIVQCCDLDGLLEMARSGSDQPPIPKAKAVSLKPLGQSIAIAKDVAFAFCYPHLLKSWSEQGASLSFFSPLANEAPRKDADAIYLPGGYPELHANILSENETFREGMTQAERDGKCIYGECGGYMVLGQGLIDATGQRHEMLGLLPVVTSFSTRSRHLGYRRLKPLQNTLFDTPMTAHEFHYSTISQEEATDRLFKAEDANGVSLGAVGHQRGNVAGSYMHLIDVVE